MMRVWGKPSSRILHYIRVRSHYFRGKARLFRWFRRLTGYPRLIISYADSGWIAVNDEGDTLERYVWLYGQHETEVWQQIQSRLVGKEVFWDVGANIGTVAIPALLDDRIVEVHCFEPDSRLLERLDFNLSLNGSHYQIHQLALSSYVGVAEFHLGSDNHADLSSLTLVRGISTTKVSVTTIDQLIANSNLHPPTVMKLDVEGSEEDVLSGARRLLSQSPPRLIVFEAECNEYGEIKNRNLIAILKAFGYSVEWIRRRSGKLHYHQERYWENYVAELCRPKIPDSE